MAGQTNPPIGGTSLQSTKIRTAVVANLGVSAIPFTGATGVASAATNTGTTAQTTGHSATGATYATSGETHTGTRRQLTCKSLSGAGAGTLTDPVGCVD
jgi:hypothetical protein